MKIQELHPSVITLEYTQDTQDKNYGSCLWATFRFDIDNGEIVITSDCGNYAYRWPEKGKEFLSLICSFDEDYLLRKLSNKDVIDEESTLSQAKDYIEEYCEDNKVEISKFNLNELTDICSSTSSYDNLYQDIEEYLDNYDIITSIDDIDNIICFDYHPQAKRIVSIFVDLIQPALKNKVNSKKNIDYPISQEMIERGLRQNIIKPYLDGELKARIGDYWFYFGESKFEHTNPNDIDFDTLVTEVKSVLDAFYECPQLYDNEYLYYYYFLLENIK